MKILHTIWQNTLGALLMLLVMLTISCNDDFYQERNGEQKQTGEPVTLRMSIELPETGITTRALDAGTAPTIESLWVAVFTQDHYLKQVAEAVPVRTNNQGHFLPDDDNDVHRLTYFDVTLNTTDENVIIHLIANYDLSTLPFGQEGQIIGGLEVTGDQDVYWQRIPSVPIKIQLDADGNYTSQMLDATSTPKVIQAPDELVEVPMVRNYAMVELELASTVTNFTLSGFALTNLPDRGSVAPRINQNTFAEYYNGAKRNATCKSYTDILAQGYKGNDPYGVVHSEELNYKTSVNDAIYTYEFNNDRDELSTMSMIIKGRYASDSKDTYYKVDLIYEDANYVTHYYNVIRNFKYKVQIERLMGSGYDTAEDAIQRPACNNISGSTIISSLTNVSNGEYQLYVDKMDLVMVHNNTYQLKYKFVKLDDMSNANSRITIVSSDCTGTGHVLSTAPQKTGTDGDWQILTLTPNNPANQAEPLVEELILIDQDTRLMRKVKLTLRRPYTMKVVLDPSTVTQTYNYPVKVSVYIPTGLEQSESMFPLSFYIDSQNNTLYPQANTDMPVVVSDGKYSFLKEIRKVDYEQLPIETTTVNIEGQSITQPMRRIDCYFMTNALQSGTTVHVNNTYFNQGEATLAVSNTTSIISNINIVGTEYYGAGHSLTLKYTLTNQVAAANMSITLTDGTQTATHTITNEDRSQGTHEVTMQTLTFSSDVSFTISVTNAGTTQTITIPNPKKRHILLIPAGSFRITDESVLGNWAIERSGDGNSYYWTQAQNAQGVTYEWPDYHVDGIASGSGRIWGPQGSPQGTQNAIEVDATYGGRVQEFTESSEFVFTTYYNYGKTQPTFEATQEEYYSREHEGPKKYAVLTVGAICNRWAETGGENGGYIDLVLNFSENVPSSLQ